MELPDDKIVSDFSDEDVEDDGEGTLRASEDAAEGSKAKAAPSKTVSNNDNNERAESNQKARSKADENHHHDIWRSRPCSRTPLARSRTPLASATAKSS